MTMYGKIGIMGQDYRSDVYMMYIFIRMAAIPSYSSTV